MIWLASYPRSGNTFFRIVLSEVYGIESSTFHNEPGYPVDEGYDSFPVVKTHLLPEQVIPSDPSIPVVYLVRDGRDTIVSMAHQRKTFQDPYSNLIMNMEEAILANEGSYFGGWSVNVSKWLERAQVVIRFEDLIIDPIGEVEKLRLVMDLPQPNIDRLPGFRDLKSKEYQYGTGAEHGFTDEDKEKHRNYFFRRGKAGGWKDEMPPQIEELFWAHHGEVMEQMGYLREPSNLAESPEQNISQPKRKVLIEGSKWAEEHLDGGKRYVQGLVDGLMRIRAEWENEFEFDITINGRIYMSVGLRDTDVPWTWRQKLAKWLFTTKFADLLLWFKKTFPWIWRGLKKIKHQSMKKLVFDKYSLVHFTVPQLFFELPEEIPAVLTVHDFSHIHYPEFHLDANVRRAEEGMEYFLKRDNSHFITVSKSTQKDMAEIHKAPEDDIELIYEAGNFRKFYEVNNPDYLDPVRQKYNLPDGRYLLCLSTIEPRKNLINTLQAFRKFSEEYPDEQVYLVVAGKKGWKYEDLFNQSIDSERIIFTGYIDDADIAAVYSGALAFLYVSYYEGFGLPILEAMSCGVPVIYGDNSSMPEIAGDGGVPVDPNDVDGIKDQIARIVKEEEWRQSLHEKALEQAMRFSWAKAARETVELYRKAALRPGSNPSSN